MPLPNICIYINIIFTYTHTSSHTHTCTHTCKTHIHACTHTCAYKYTPGTHTYICTFLYTYIHMYLLVHIHTYVPSCTHTYICTFLNFAPVSTILPDTKISSTTCKNITVSQSICMHAVCMGICMHVCMLKNTASKCVCTHAYVNIFVWVQL